MGTALKNLRNILVLILIFPFVTELCSQSLDPGKPPGGNFNLTNFYLGLPVDSSGGTSGSSASISAAQLTGGYSNALFFYTAQDGAMTFWSPVTGATTPGSSYPRSELREQIVPGNNDINWLPYGVHTLTAQCRVTQVPSTAKVIIGQIHCKTGNARPLLKLQYNNGVIEALVKTNSNFNPDYKFIFQNVGLGNLITYQIRQENGLLTTTVNGSNQTINVFATDPDWATNGFYFKAGSYCQDNAGPTNEGSRVAFYALNRSHTPSITNHPAGHTTVVGSNTTFTVHATGNGPLRYQWRFNGTNLSTAATNATLTLTNLQPASAGDYSVRVADNLGATTSAVATLTILVPPAITSQPTNVLAVAGSDATFASTVNGSTPLRLQWLFNTNAVLDGATNSTLVISNVTLADEGMYSMTASNDAGAVITSFASLTVNHPPVPGSVTGVTGQSVPVSIPASSVLDAASDPDGDIIALESVAPESANGGSLSLNGSHIAYTPALDFTGVDQWIYTLTDVRGASVSATASISVIAWDSITLSPASQTLMDDGSFRATFIGVPGLTYTVDCSTNPAGPWATGYTNLTAGTNGLFQFIETPPLPQPDQFYRVRYP
ncbi:MAG TPA: polysaccharide lyase family 7 protein [Verrucomicrobiota bacterium]|nr:polysaccharide lyase family 7 protein [Verrucomicrobiota bacterium]